MLHIFSTGVVGPVNIFTVRVANLGQTRKLADHGNQDNASFKLYSTCNLQVFNIQMHSVM